jgi:phytoene synthase
MSDYNTYRKSQYSDDLNYCKQFIFSFGSNYSLGVKIFPKDIREATIFYYAFVRYPDEIVDNPEVSMPGQTHLSIEEFITEWKEVTINGPTKETHPILRGTYWVFKNKGIPFEYSFDFLDAMRQDTIKDTYKNYRELERYMWGSASVVGHVMTFIVGYRDASAFEHARSLGEAMQLANILRDIHEDNNQRNRIYLPQNDMTLFAVSESMLRYRKMTPELFNFVKHYYERTEILFTKGMNGIHYLNHGKFSIFLVSRIYRENIRILRKRNFNIFLSPIRISKPKKFWILITSLFLYPYFLFKTNLDD